ncbi:MAG: CRISPR-associated RAMP family protein [Gammaproteobacteria bacterium RIFOXYA12_FULL_61_12]|nr:MAG: CRISPR-associated RAMP family protein [Gammaproteobacteria bacterium RIFOXYA12_FULL_61_12]
MTAINAPYNFVPLSEMVVTPEWAALVSHDLPFKDGISGEIHYVLTAHSPLLVGGEQTKATDHAPGNVRFFKTPDGQFAIPGSSLKGMIRSVLEIATFSRMGMVDDKRYGLRDISGKYVADSYTSRVRNRVQAGFLRLSRKGEPEILPCDMARFSHRDLESWWGEDAPIFKKGERVNGKYKPTTVADKYKRWDVLCKKHKIASPFNFKITVSGDNVSAIGAGSIDGFPVFTGQISDCTDDKFENGKWTRGKYHDFIFHSSRGSHAFSLHEVDPNAWRDFLFIHGDEDSKPVMPWPGFWKDKFWKKEKVPVFFIRNGNRLQIGLAYMPKLAGDFSIHDMIGHTSKDHLEGSKADFATLLFGQIGDSPEDALKGRVQFELARLNGQAEAIAQPTSILNSPKPSYFPNYIRQKTTGPGWKLTGGDNAQYATYLETQAHPEPELRGWKRYPARPEAEVRVQEPIGDQAANKKIQLRLHPLPKDTKFSGRMVFHNLKREELGALLWCLNFGGCSNYRHGLGLGKSFGFGQVGIVLDSQKSWIAPNLPEGEAMKTLDQWNDCCLNRFIAYMDKALGESWMKSPQIMALLAMADPLQRDKFKGQLKHMVLARIPAPTEQNPNKKETRNQFLDAKQAGLVLAPYIPLPATGPASTVLGSTAEATWPSVSLSFEKGPRKISAFRNGETASIQWVEAGPLLSALDESSRRRLEKGKLTATLTLKPLGRASWKIVGLTPDHA